MCTFAYIERVLDNGSVAAFLGALAAFLLVIFTDWRRNRRKAKNVFLEVESCRFHAEKKRQTVIDNRNQMRTANKLMPGRFIPFNSGLVRQLATEVLDQLTQDQRRAIDAIVFRMEGCDQLLEEAYVVSRMFSDPVFQEGRIAKANELLTIFGDAIVNLGILIQMCRQFTAREYRSVLEAQHDPREFEVP